MQNDNPKLRDHLRDVIFGLEDGMVSTLGVVTGVAIGSGSRWIVLLAGLVTIFVESLSMAAGTYLSSKAEREGLEKEIGDQKRRILEDHPQEMEEWRQSYRDRGLHETDIKKIEHHFRKDRELLLEDMMHKELGITRRFLRNPSQGAFFMLISYFVGGVIALGAYFFFPLEAAISIAVVCTFVVLFFVGFAKGRFVGVSPWKSGFEMLLISLIAAVVGFIVGKLAGSFLPSDLV